MAVWSVERWWHPYKDSPVCPNCRREFPGLRGGTEVWQEVPIGAGWTAALRVGVQNGHPIVAELRVFPAEPGVRDAGRWSVEPLGIAEAARFVPPGGLTTRKLRDVKIAEPLVAALPHISGSIASTRAAYVGVDDPGDLPLVVPGMESAAGAGVKRNRAAQVSDRELANFAARYMRLAESPTTSRMVSRALAKELGENVGRVRQLTHAARRRGLLTGGGKGRAGGVLTAKARALLAGAATASSTVPRKRNRKEPRR